MNRKIYERLARKYGVTVDDIKRDMGEDVMAQNMTKDVTVPTVDEFINLVVNKIKNEIKNEEIERTAAEIEHFNNLADTPLKKLIMDLWVSYGNNILAEQNLLSEFKNKESDELYEYSFGLGLFLRNNILTEESEIYKIFKENGIHGRDDMSSVIISTWHTALQHQ